MKRILLATALLSLALASGCATGGSGPCAVNCPSLTVEAASGPYKPITQAALGLQLTLTATFVNTGQTPLNWTISGSSCTGSGPSNPCGYFPTSSTSSTITYQAPTSVPSSPTFTITATAQSNGALTGKVNLTIVAETADVAPATVNVEVGLTQQFTAVALPDQVPQTFTWTCLASGVPCANFTPAGNQVGTAVYTPISSEKCTSGTGCVQVCAVPTTNPSYSCTSGTSGQTTPVDSRVTGTYSFEFSGYDSNGAQITGAGTFTVQTNGSISGYEDEMTAGGLGQYSFTGGAYTPITGSNVNSNNAGTLTLPTGAFPNSYEVVLDAAGDIQMIASDAVGDSVSGFAEPSSKGKFTTCSGQPCNQTYAFGFTGVDASGNRIGYAGLLPLSPSSSCSGGSASCGTVTSGLMDVNDAGNSTNSICPPSSAPCAVNGSYYSDPSIANLWHLALASPIAMTFDFFIANGSGSANNPLVLYSISTDSNPSVLGTMKLQDPKLTYNNAAFNATGVAALTGANGNVALIIASTDGTSSGTGVSGACPASGTGNVSGNFDQNNAGTILQVKSFPSAAQSSNPYTYVATNGNTGRYIFCLLGNPNASQPVLPIPFVLYANDADSGYLLDQSSSSVLTGPMIVQQPPKQNDGLFANSAMTGTYAVATYTNSVSAIAPLNMNLLLTSPGNAIYVVGGVQNPGNQAISTGSYSVLAAGNGTLDITLSSSSTAADYVTYGVTETDFFVIEENSGSPSPILYMAQ